MRAMVAAVAIALGASPMPAAAQRIYGPPPSAPRAPTISADRIAVARDVADAREQIHRGRAERSLSRRQARGLRREANQIDTLADRYAADGLSDAERRELDSRARVLRDVTNGQRILSPGPRR